VKTWKKIINEEAEFFFDQTQLKTPRRNVEGEEKNIDNQAKNKDKRSTQSERSKLAADAT